MRKLTLLAIVAGLLHPWDAFANFPKDTQSWPGYNMIGDLNPGFENGTTQWTATAGGTFTASTSVYAEGLRAAAWTPSASGQFLTSPAAAVGSNINAAGRNGVASCLVRTSASGYTLEAIDGSSNVLVSSSITSSSAGFVRVSGNFIFPNGAGTSVKVRIKSAGTTIAYVDSCYIGPAEGFNISQVSQASFFGSTRISGMSANWSVSGTGVQDFPAIASATYTVAGNALSPTTNIPAIRFTNLPPGTYQIIARASMTQGASAGQCYYRLWDGSSYIGTDMLTTAANQDNPGPLTGSVTYSTTQSDITFRIRMRDQSLANNCLIRASAWNDLQVEFQVYRFPTSSELAARPDQQPLSYSAQGNLSGSTSSTTLADLGSISGSLTQVSAQNLSCSTASGQVGITCNLLRAGAYQVCFSGSTFPSVSSTADYVLTDGSNNILAANQRASASAGFYVSIGQCAQYTASATGNVTFKLRALTNTGSTTGIISAISVTQLTASTPAPILVGSVTSNSTGAERVERVRVGGAGDPSNCTSSPCTIYNQSGSWISSVTRSSAGQYTANITAGIFSFAPTCTISAVNVGVTPLMAAVNTRSATSFQFSTFNGSTTVAADSMYDIICMGPR